MTGYRRRTLDETVWKRLLAAEIQRAVEAERERCLALAEKERGRWPRGTGAFKAAYAIYTAIKHP